MQKEVADKTIELGKLILDFAKVNRISYHEDGIRPESDTDHTVMLGVIACAFASEFRKDLDVGLIAQLAFVHDLVEAYAGDTAHFGGRMSEEVKKDKEKRESDALAKIKSQFANYFPWVHEMIEKYERLDSNEAKFLKSLDKVMPKINVVLNKGVTLRGAGYDKESAEIMLREQSEKMKSTYAKDHKEVMELFDLISKAVCDVM